MFFEELNEKSRLKAETESSQRDSNPSPSSKWPQLQRWHRITLILVAVTLAEMVAILTRQSAHPDEYLHIDAFRYFEDNWWPPNLGAEDLVYSRYGVSRVYNAEIVYIIYGRLGKIIRIFWKPDEPPYQVYRLINVSLFPLTLVGLFFASSKCIDPTIIGITFLCIPQVHYIYAYANSDAWGLSASVFLFLLALNMSDKPAKTWSWWKLGLLAVLTGLIILSPKEYLFSLFLPYSLLSMRIFQAVKRNNLSPSPIRWLGIRLAALGMLVVAATAPLKVVYPMTQRRFILAGEQMQEAKALCEFKLSNPTFQTLRLASKGEGYFSLLAKRSWVKESLKSFYGVFGWLDVYNPRLIYWTAGFSALLGFCLTMLGTVRNWQKLNDALRTCLILAPIVAFLNICASLRYSLYCDYQPQGRYLFPSLIAVSLMLMATAHVEEKKLKLIRARVLAVMYILCVYSLVFVCIIKLL